MSLPLPFTSSNEDVTSINEDGLISAISEGSTIISASIGDVIDSIEVVVNPIQQEGSVQTYLYVLNQSDFTGSGYDTSAGSAYIDGLTWDYEAFPFLGQSADGVQIGSNKQPPRDGWTISTTFPGEIIMLNYEITLKTNSPASYKVSMGEYVSEEEIPGNSVTTVYGEEGLDIKTTDSSLTLTNQTKAVYLYSIYLELFVPEGVDLSLTIKEDELTPIQPGEGDVPNVNYELIDKEQYYSSIDFNSDASTLKEELSTLISNMTRISYGDDTYIMIYTDESVEKLGTLYGIYGGDEIAAEADGTWNKEHVWVCSQMKKDGVDPRPSSDDKNHATDLHNLRVACQNSNGQHGNKFYDNTNGDITFFPNIEDDGSAVHEYKGDHRGDLARILFYMAIRYDFLSLTDDIENANDTSMGRLSVLLEWHKLDPADEFETQRNNRIYEFQGNRNPFIDYPGLVDVLY